MIIFDKIPDEILTVILADWIGETSDFISLDTANCNREFRWRYLKSLTLAFPEISFRAESINNACHFLKWLKARKLSMKTLTLIPCSCVVSGLSTLLLSTEPLRSLKFLHIEKQANRECADVDISLLLQALPELETLTIRNNTKGDLDITYQNAIHMKSSLQCLQLYHIPLHLKKAIGIAHWIADNCPQLQSLHFIHCGMIPDIAFYLIHHLPLLHTIVYEDSNHSTHMRALIDNILFDDCMHMKTLSFPLHHQMKPAYAFTLLQHCPTLTFLQISLGKLDTGQDISTVLQLLPSWKGLHTLHLACEGMTDMLLQQIALHCTLLHTFHLHIPRSEYISDIGLQAMCNVLGKQLQSFELSYAHTITDQGLKSFTQVTAASRTERKLQHLGLTDCAACTLITYQMMLTTWATSLTSLTLQSLRIEMVHDIFKLYFTSPALLAGLRVLTLSVRDEMNIAGEKGMQLIFPSTTTIMNTVTTSGCKRSQLKELTFGKIVFHHRMLSFIFTRYFTQLIHYIGSIFLTSQDDPGTVIFEDITLASYAAISDYIHTH